MPTYDEINLTGMDIDDLDWGGSRLRVSFGHGYGAFARTGNPSGLHHWKISDSGVLPDRAGSDYGPIGSQSRFDYYYEFFKSHTTGAEEIFIIEWRGKKYHACFTDAKQSYQRFTEDLFSGGVDIEQRRVAGFTYSADGSLPFPGLPTLTTLTVVGHYSISIAWTAEVGDQTGYEVLIDETSVFDVGNVLTHTFSFFSPGTTHSFRVRSYDGVPLRSAYSNSLSGTTTVATLSVLVDGSGRVLVDGSGHALVSEV